VEDEKDADGEFTDMIKITSKVIDNDDDKAKHSDNAIVTGGESGGTESNFALQ
jgi:hypothetical protein